MAEFRIKATSGQTGKDYFISILAANGEAAERIAVSEGHVIERGSALLVAEDKIRRVRSKTSGCSVLGLMFLVVGFGGLLCSTVLPTSVRSEGFGGMVNNIGLLNDRALMASIAGACLITGAVFMSAGAIGSQMRALARP